MIASHPDNPWEQLFQKLAPRLILFARQFEINSADAEDLVQDAFVKCWRKGSRDEALYFSAVRSLSIDRARSRLRREERERQAVEECWFQSGGDGASILPESVEQALTALPSEQREAVVLKIWGNLTFAEAARVLEIPQNTVASRYRYAMTALRQTLQADIAP